MLNGSGIRINKLSYKRKEIEREEYSCTQGCSSPFFLFQVDKRNMLKIIPVTALSQLR